MNPSEMTVWDRLAMHFPDCTADEIKTWADGRFDKYCYDIVKHTIRRIDHDEWGWLDEEGLRAAIDAMKPKPWHVVAQEALADWAKGIDLTFKYDDISDAIRYELEGEAFVNVYSNGNISRFDSYSAQDARDNHNEIASLLRAAGLTQFKTYKLVEDTDE